MSSNRVGDMDIDMPLITETKPTTWKELVEEKMEGDKSLVGVTCHCYSTSVGEPNDEEKQCLCGRLAHRHSFEGQAQRDKLASKTTFTERPFLTTVKPLTAYGQLGQHSNGARFIRCYSGRSNVSEILSDLLVKDVGAKPDLLISCFGGAKHFNMTDKLEKEFMNGISQVAGTKGVWLLTTGLNEGVSKLIGQNVHHFTLLNKKPIKPTIIGLTSWGTLTEHTQEVLKRQTRCNMLNAGLMQIGGKKMINLNYSEGKTLDKYHTHFLLLDNGRMNIFLDDRPRVNFVEAMSAKTGCHAITIIIEGGLNTPEVILNDLQNKRPVVIIQGSGRLANVLGTLIELSTKNNALEEKDVKNQLASFFPDFENRTEDIKKSVIININKVLSMEHRNYLNIFKLERDTSLTDMIFKAVDKVQTYLVNLQQKNFLRLAITWNYIPKTQAMPKRLEDDRKLYPELFQQSLIENRPVFVDYFLRRYHDPLQTDAYEKIKLKPNYNTTWEDARVSENTVRVACAFYLIIDELYPAIEAPTDHWATPRTIEELDKNYRHLIGPYTKSFYFERSTFDRLSLDFKSLFHRNRTDDTNIKSTEKPDIQKMCMHYSFKKHFDKQEMLRELFLWSVYAGHSDIAFVLLLQIESRIAAALIAGRIAKHISLFARRMDLRHLFDQQTKDYEEYARACVTACYNHNERLACQLLVRENPLFGDVTCMQVAIASRSIPVINTNCFNQVLNREWFGQLAGNTTESLRSKIEFVLSLITLGLAAPFLITYRRVDPDDETQQDNRNENVGEHSRRWKGIEDQTIQSPTYWDKFVYFHQAPVVKMSYHFIIYVWFLLVFSYMILFDMRPDEDSVHWTQIYLIITVSTMLIEDFRQFVVDYYTHMLERWHMTDLWMVPVYAMPYALFYIGIICYYRSGDRLEVFTAARIILAIDLELWYLYSLRFVTAIKLLGPKLIMIRNMLRDLTAFMYIIFVCIAAYGVVSRALIMYNTLEFTAKSIFTAIFYQPYWFLYSIVESEKNTLDDIIANSTASREEVTKATVNHVLLAFHMLFINILILNLLIAVFNFSISDVQDKNEFFWRYQRYELIREYFEMPILAYPPLSLVAYIGWLINVWFFNGTTFRVFRRLRNQPAMDTHWTEFENAATYEHARHFVEEKYRPKDETTFSTLQAQIDSLKNENEQIRVDTGEIKNKNEQIRVDTEEIKNRVTTSMNWMMAAIARVKMSCDPVPTFPHQSSSDV